MQVLHQYSTNSILHVGTVHCIRFICWTLSQTKARYMSYILGASVAKFLINHFRYFSSCSCRSLAHPAMYLSDTMKSYMLQFISDTRHQSRRHYLLSRSNKRPLPWGSGWEGKNLISMLVCFQMCPTLTFHRALPIVVVSKQETDECAYSRRRRCSGYRLFL